MCWLFSNECYRIQLKDTSTTVAVHEELRVCSENVLPVYAGIVWLSRLYWQCFVIWSYAVIVGLAQHAGTIFDLRRV